MNRLPFFALTPFLLLPALCAETTGYADSPIQLTPVDVKADKENNFSLPLDAVVNSGSRLGLTNRELPASVSIITQEMMQLRGLRTAVEAVEAAVGMTGGTNFGSIPNYSTRGFGGNNVTILRDGIRQNTASQASRTIDSYLLDRVEILKGPAGLMFGEGAIGGAVNYISKAPAEKPGGDLLLSYGAWNSLRFGLGAGGPVHFNSASAPLNVRIDYSHSETDGYQDDNRQRYDAGSVALGWKPTSRLTLTFSSAFLDDWNQSYYGSPVIYDAVVNTTVAGSLPEVRAFNATTDRMVNPRVDSSARRTNYNVLDNYAATQNSYNRLRADLRVTDGIDLHHETYVTTQLLKWRNEESNTWNPASQLVTRGNLTLIYRDDVLWGDRLEVSFRQTIAGHSNRLVIGSILERNNQIRGGAPGNANLAVTSVALLHPDVGYGPVASFKKTSRIIVETHAFHLEDVFEVSSALKIIGGLRYDHLSLQRDTLANPTTAPTTAFSTFRVGYRPLTGRVGAVWSATKGINFYASYSKAAEPVTQLVSLNSTQADYSLQKGRQFETGLKGTFLDKRLDTTLAWFDIEKKDLLTSTLDPSTGTRISQQIGAQTSRGIEAAVAFSPGEGWRLEANGAYTDARYRAFNENLGTSVISRAGKRPSNVPEWVANLFIAKRLTPGLMLSGGPRYVSDRFGNNNNSVIADHYVAFDAAMGYTWRRWEFTLRGRNLLNEDYEPVAGTTMRRLADPRSGEISTRLAF